MDNSEVRSSSVSVRRPKHTYTAATWCCIAAMGAVLAVPWQCRAADLPDLAPISLMGPSAVTATPYPSVTLAYAVTNRGDGPAIAPDNWYDMVYVSTNPVLDLAEWWLLAGVLVGTESGPVGPGEVYQRTVTVNLPVTQSGSYYLFLQVDAFGALAESSISNNLVSVPIFFDLRAPDLMPLALIAPTNIVASACPTVTVAWGVTNQGIGAAGFNRPWVDELYLSATGNVDGWSLLLANNAEAGPLLPGQSYWRTNTVRLPAVRSGIAYYIFRTDAYDSQGDSAPDNNTLAVPLTFQLQLSLAGANRRSDGSFELTVYTDWHGEYSLEASTNLVNWEEVLQFAGVGSPTNVVDAGATNFTQRFYRVILRP